MGHFRLPWGAVADRECNVRCHRSGRRDDKGEMPPATTSWLSEHCRTKCRVVLPAAA